MKEELINIETAGQTESALRHYITHQLALAKHKGRTAITAIQHLEHLKTILEKELWDYLNAAHVAA